MKAPDFDELVGPDLPPDERMRLRRAHDLLVAAGPPPQLPAHLTTPPVRALRRRRIAIAALAAALALAAFGAGWSLRDGDESFEVRRSVPMHSTASAPGASATLDLGFADDEGNWPMLVTVSGLEPLPDGGYYELLLTKDGEPVAVCGSFKVSDEGPTTVRLGASYNLREFDGWVVRPYIHGRDRFNETVVLTT